MLFLLISYQKNRLLPTIVSRCQRIVMQCPDQRICLDWLQQQKLAEKSAKLDAQALLAEAGGAPLAALKIAQEEKESSPRHHLLKQLEAGALCDVLGSAETLAEQAFPPLLLTLQRWAFDLFSQKLTATTRFYPAYQPIYAALVKQVNIYDLLKFLSVLNKERTSQDHPLNTRLLLEMLLLKYRALFN